MKHHFIFYQYYYVIFDEHGDYVMFEKSLFPNSNTFNSKPPFTDTSSFTLFVSFAKHLRPNQLEQIFNKFGKLKGITFLS